MRIYLMSIKMRCKLFLMIKAKSFWNKNLIVIWIKMSSNIIKIHRLFKFTRNKKVKIILSWKMIILFKKRLLKINVNSVKINKKNFSNLNKIKFVKKKIKFKKIKLWLSTLKKVKFQKIKIMKK